MSESVMDEILQNEIKIARDQVVAAALHWRASIMEMHEPTVRTWQDMKLIEATQDLWALMGLKSEARSAKASS